jgi:hypothetical protein
VVRHTPLVQNHKRQGAYYEQLFATEAFGRGLAVSFPLGDYLPYDCIIGNNASLSRVQVKGTTGGANGRYVFHLGVGKHKVLSHEFEFFAGFADQGDTGWWYIIPKKDLDRTVKALKVYPHVPRSKGKYERFQRAWHLFPGLK